MTVEIRYYTRSGNTEKLAQAMANAIDVMAKSVTEPLDKQVDILLLGASYYGFDVDDAIKNFIKDNHDKIGKIVCFGTSAMMKSLKKPIGKLADAYGIALSEEEFHCRGKFGPIHKTRPNEEDLTAAADFAKAITQAVSC